MLGPRLAYGGAIAVVERRRRVGMVGGVVEFVRRAVWRWRVTGNNIKARRLHSEGGAWRNAPRPGGLSAVRLLQPVHETWHHRAVGA